MDMDLVSCFTDRLLEDHREEVEEGSKWAVILLKNEARKVVWNMCSLMGTEKHGVQGQACRLLERYLASHLQENAHLAVDNDSWEGFKKALAARVPIVLGSCIQLAAKMSSAGIQVNPSLVRACLQYVGFTYSAKEIIASEFHVFKTIGYRVPLWSSVDAALVIAVKANLPTELFEGIALVVNMCEYHRDVLNDRVCSIARISPRSKIPAEMLSTLHLAAGAVLASARFLDSLDRETTALIARLTQATSCYLKCVSDIIVSDVISMEDDQPSDGSSPPKRRRLKA